MTHLLRKLRWHDDEGQDIAEYAVMLAVILVIVVGTIRLVGSNANNVFSQAASSIQSRQSKWAFIMARNRGNPDWGRPTSSSPALATEFELRVRQLRLKAEMYTSSAGLRT
jgi:Flp pilus assembly pilin Flp